ncbi:phytanoyl-CoA dioxygenase family protein [Marinimicrobium agarilyticum]|uniref:phytanoyl-CoA dioxygenase family protein n=1 Tax=Marinimicrobium agarilyticum TaxID=306546 RepID=UPI000489CF87|nr:phytanoyl-CoA dioxygenase family protein [Marinimicrobium agarilyticum]
MIKEYEENGYLVLEGFVGESELQKLREVAVQFHQSWKQGSARLYNEGAVNSAYLTAKKHLKDSERELLFKFIGSVKLMGVVSSIMGGRPAFMNTQLFFDPVNEGQRSYWHRDPQYHMSIDEQKQSLLGPNVVHFRVPLVDEPGVELVPGTHRRWDSGEELDVRLEQNGRKNYEDLSSGVNVKLNAGDLLVFDAGMIHRGIYGMGRLSLDILFCDSVPKLVKFVDDSCLPNSDMLTKLEDASAFSRAVEIKFRNRFMEAKSV